MQLLCRGKLYRTVYDETSWAKVGKVTLKSNGDEALSNEFLLKSNGDEAFNSKEKL